LHVHLLFLLEEAAGRVRNRLEVVRDLVDHDGFHADADALGRYALEVELGLVDVEREAAHLLQAWHDPGALADDDLEAETGRISLRAAMGAVAGDDQRFVRLGNPVQEHDWPPSARYG